jgi:Zn-finger nucleic acid-binding protein
VGPISAGFVIDHLCENPRCCNPSHLQMTTQRNNLLRTARTQAGCNARKPMCPKCGGPWSERTKVDGRFRGRYCKPCFNEYKRGKLPEYRAKNAAYKKAYRARAGAA